MCVCVCVCMSGKAVPPHALSPPSSHTPKKQTNTTQGTWSLKTTTTTSNTEKEGKVTTTTLTLKYTAPTATTARFHPAPQGWERFTDGSASLAFHPQPPSSPAGETTTRRSPLTIVRAIHVDHFEGLSAPAPPEVALALPGCSLHHDLDHGQDEEGGECDLCVICVCVWGGAGGGVSDGVGWTAGWPPIHSFISPSMCTHTLAVAGAMEKQQQQRVLTLPELRDMVRARLGEAEMAAFAMTEEVSE